VKAGCEIACDADQCVVEYLPSSDFHLLQRLVHFHLHTSVTPAGYPQQQQQQQQQQLLRLRCFGAAFKSRWQQQLN